MNLDDAKMVGWLRAQMKIASFEIKTQSYEHAIDRLERVHIMSPKEIMEQIKKMEEKK